MLGVLSSGQVMKFCMLVGLDTMMSCLYLYCISIYILTQLVVEVDLFLSLPSPQQVKYYVCKVLRLSGSGISMLFKMYKYSRSRPAMSNT